MRNFKFLFLFLFFAACHSSLQIKEQQQKNVKLKADSLLSEDAAIKELIAPYKIKLDSQMNIRIMVASADLKKETPEGALGNMVCDVLMRYAKANKQKVDFCILNNGGLRIPVIYKGDITVRTVYELMPFDNNLVVLKLSGQKCLEMFATIAQFDGVPVSGLRLQIEGNQATQISINGVVFDPSKDYYVLTSDYLANGGDKAEALKNPIEYKDLQIKLRDALILQMKEMYYSGETLQALKDGRITKK